MTEEERRKLMEDPMVLFDDLSDKTREKRTYYINVKEIPADEVENFIKEIIQKTKKRYYE